MPASRDDSLNVETFQMLMSARDQQHAAQFSEVKTLIAGVASTVAQVQLELAGIGSHLERLYDRTAKNEQIAQAAADLARLNASDVEEMRPSVADAEKAAAKSQEQIDTIYKRGCAQFEDHRAIVQRVSSTTTTTMMDANARVVSIQMGLTKRQLLLTVIGLVLAGALFVGRVEAMYLLGKMVGR